MLRSRAGVDGQGPGYSVGLGRLSVARAAA